MVNRCHECGQTDDEARLHKCPICFRYYCEEHSSSMSGRTFCSQKCAEYFFFADPDDEEDE